MAAKIFVVFALLALSMSVASAVTFPQYIPPLSALAATHPCVQYNILQQALWTIITPSSAIILQQPLALLQQQCLAHMAIQGITTQQQQLLNPLATAATATNLQQQQLVNPLAVASLVAYSQQQQQQQQLFNPLATASFIAYSQQQQLFNPLAAASLVAYSQQQQQQLLNLLATVSPITYWQQQQYLFNSQAAVSSITYWNKQQQLLNPLAVVSLANIYLQQQIFNPLAVATPAAY